MELRSTLPLSEKSDDKNFLHGGYWVLCMGLERNDCTKKRKTRILMRDVLSKGAPSSTYRWRLKKEWTIRGHTSFRLYLSSQLRLEKKNKKTKNKKQKKNNNNNKQHLNEKHAERFVLKEERKKERRKEKKNPLESGTKVERPLRKQQDPTWIGNERNWMMGFLEFCPVTNQQNTDSAARSAQRGLWTRS